MSPIKNAISIFYAVYRDKWNRIYCEGQLMHEWERTNETIKKIIPNFSTWKINNEQKKVAPILEG